MRNWILQGRPERSKLMNSPPPPIEARVVQKATRRFWVLSCLIYMTLIYTSAIQFAFGPEKTIALTFFSSAKSTSPTLQEHFPDKGSWADKDLQGIDSRFLPVDFWKLSSLWGDAGYYILQSEDLLESIPPFKYRFLPTGIVGAMHSLTGAPVPILFAVMNCILTLATAVLFTRFLLFDLGFSDLPSMLGGILFVTMAANTQTIPFPMLEPASFLFCVIIFRALYRGDWLMFMVASSLGVACKEILVATSLLWVANNLDAGVRPRRGWLRAVGPAMAPILVFMAIRLALGGGAFDVNYGFDLLKGELPLQYAARLLVPWKAADVIIRVFLAFSFIWIGIMNYRKHPFIARNVFIIPLVIIATVVLSSRITRILGVVFPIVIPAFLLFLEQSAGGDISRREGARLETEETQAL